MTPWEKIEHFFDVLVKILFFGIIGGSFVLTLATHLLKSTGGFLTVVDTFDGVNTMGTLGLGFILLFHWYRIFWVKFCFLISIGVGIFTISPDMFVASIFLLLFISACIEFIYVSWRYFAIMFLSARYGFQGGAAFMIVDRYLSRRC